MDGTLLKIAPVHESSRFVAGGEVGVGLPVNRSQRSRWTHCQSPRCVA